jgi:hypothetical protein
VLLGIVLLLSKSGESLNIYLNFTGLKDANRKIGKPRRGQEPKEKYKWQ